MREHVHTKRPAVRPIALMCALCWAGGLSRAPAGNLPSVELGQDFYGPAENVQITVSDPDATVSSVSLETQVSIFSADGQEVDVETGLLFESTEPGVFLSAELPLSEKGGLAPNNGVLEVADLAYISVSYNPPTGDERIDSRPYRSDPPTIWRGLPAFPLGTASLSINQDDHLVIENLGSAGTDGAVFYGRSPGAEVRVDPITLTEDGQSVNVLASVTDINGNRPRPNILTCPPVSGVSGACGMSGSVTRVLSCCQTSTVARVRVFGGSGGERLVNLAGGNTATRVADVMPITSPPSIVTSTPATFQVNSSTFEPGIEIQLNRTVNFVNIPGHSGTTLAGDRIRLTCPGEGFEQDRRVGDLTLLAASLPRVVLMDVQSLPTAAPVFGDGFETGDTSSWSVTVPGTSRDFE